MKKKDPVAIVALETPPDSVEAVFAFLPVDKLFLPATVIVARWRRPGHELIAGVVVQSHKDYDRIVHAFATAKPGKRLEIKHGAVIKRLL